MRYTSHYCIALLQHATATHCCNTLLQHNEMRYTQYTYTYIHTYTYLHVYITQYIYICIHVYTTHVRIYLCTGYIACHFYVLCVFCQMRRNIHSIYIHIYIHMSISTCIRITKCDTLLQHTAATHCCNITKCDIHRTTESHYCNTLLQHATATHCFITLLQHNEIRYTLYIYTYIHTYIHIYIYT